MSDPHPRVPPRLPCPACGGTTFVTIGNVRMESDETDDDNLGYHRTEGGFHLDLVVCADCGRTELFLRNLRQIANAYKVVGVAQVGDAADGAG